MTVDEIEEEKFNQENFEEDNNPLYDKAYDIVIGLGYTLDEDDDE